MASSSNSRTLVRSLGHIRGARHSTHTRSFATPSSEASSSTPRPNPSSSGSSSSSSTASTPQPLRAALLLSRPPLLTPILNPLQKTYQSYNLSLLHSLSNPPPLPFYFRPDSLPLRRFLLSSHAYNSSIYGADLAGPAPSVGDIPPETQITEVERDRWAKEDAGRGEASLERLPEEEVFCLVQNKDQGGRWEMPWVEVGNGEGLDAAVERGLTGLGSGLDGKGMDSWLVTKKPIGFTKTGDRRTFFLRSHILGGEPTLASSTPWSSCAWLSAREVQERLKDQKDGQSWEEVRGMFGIGADEDEVFLKSIGLA